jgi:hypothetical protein
MRHYLPRILGFCLLICALLLLIWMPPKEHFSAAALYAFLACLVVGVLLLIGYVGTAPRASQLRAEAATRGTSRTGPLISVPEQVFFYATHSRGQAVAAGVCVVLGVAMLALGVFLAIALPLSPLDRSIVWLPEALAGACCIWVPLRQLRMYVRAGPDGVRARVYFRTVSIGWEEIVALVIRENYLLMFGPLGTTYSIYSLRTRIDFADRLKGAPQLAGIVTQATGLPWQSGSR